MGTVTPCARGRDVTVSDRVAACAALVLADVTNGGATQIADALEGIASVLYTEPREAGNG